MNIKAVRGTKDILGEDSQKYNYIVKTASEYFDKYGCFFPLDKELGEDFLFNLQYFGRLKRIVFIFAS